MGRPLKGRGSQKTCLIRDPYTTEVRSLLLWGDGKNGFIPDLYILGSGIFYGGLGSQFGLRTLRH
jgi:hypothetical protein